MPSPFSLAGSLGAGGAVVGKAVVQLVADTSGLSKDVAAAQKQVETSTGKMGSAVTGFSNVTRYALGAAGLAFGAFLVKGIQGAINWQRVMAQTNAVIESTGGVAGVTAEEVRALAESIEDVSGVEAEAIVQAENLLLTFVNVRNEVGEGNDVFNQATQLIADMSVALGQDMKSSAIQLGKALNDPVRGINALRRVGVSFTAEQTETVKRLVATNQTLEAQKLILAELRMEFGGSAEALGRTFTGRVAILRDRFFDLAELIGVHLLPALTRIVDVAVDLVTALEPVFGLLGDIVRITAQGVGWLVKFAAAVADVNPLLLVLLGYLVKQGVVLAANTAAWATLSAAIGRATAATVANTAATQASNAAHAANAGLLAKAAGAIAAIPGPLKVAAAVAVGMGFLIKKSMEDSEKAAESFGSELRDVGKGLLENLPDIAGRTKVSAKDLGIELDFSGVYEGLEEPLSTLDIFGDKFADAFAMANDGLKFTTFMLEQADKAYLDGSISAEQYVDVLNRLGLEGPEHLKRVQLQLKDLTSASDEALTGIEGLSEQGIRQIETFTRVTGSSFEEFVQQAREAGQDLEDPEEAVRQFTRQTIQSIRQWRHQAAERFADVSGVLSRFAAKSKVNINQVIRAFHAQAREVTTFTKLWRQVSERLGDDADSLKVALQDMGLDAIPILRAMRDAGKRDLGTLREYVSTLEGSADDAATTLQKDLIGSIKDLTNSIRTLAGLDRIDFQFDADTSRARVEVESFIRNYDGRDIFFNVHARQVQHSGGIVRGTEREVPILAEPGEFVIRRQAVNRLGRAYLEAINRMHEGGLVPPVELQGASSPPVTRTSITVNVQGRIDSAGDLRRELDWWARTRGW